MARLLTHRLAVASAALVTGLAALGLAATSGEVRVGAGDIEVLLGADAEAALAMRVGERSCPPHCGLIEIGWRPDARIDEDAGAVIMDAALRRRAGHTALIDTP
ncbi:MAG: hypothetical protein AAF719_14825 [Pseudomonadota bacterium]